IPFCAVSIAVEKKGEIIAGVVYAPLLNEYYFAEKKQGATLNNKPITVSQKKEVARACLCTGFPYKYVNIPNGPLDIFNRFIKQGIPVRRFGAAAIDLCWVAAGRLDGFWEYNLSPWDSAAGFLIVKEAGGKVTDFQGENYSPYSPFILATNGIIHQSMLKNINL
ncbi:MAG: inositol monophosphatase family protein, partial [Chitinophagaceae bacterium]